VSRVAIVVSHPIQHFCPLYRAVAEDGRLRVKVFFASTAGARPYFDPDFNREVHWQSDIMHGFDYEFLPGADAVKDLTKPLSNAALPGRLQAFDPDAVLVYGFFHGISRTSIRWARKHGRGVLLISDSELRSRRSPWVRLRKAMTVPWMLRGVNGFLTVGDCNEAYYLRYGARRDQMYRCPLPIDEASLSAAMARRTECRSDLRDRLGVPADALLALVVGKLTRRKSPDHAVRALAEARKADPQLARLLVILAGDGPEAESLAELGRQLCPNGVKMPGFVEVRALAGYYVGADFLVHPSSEDPHPLATSEAAYAGLPCIVSDRVGSVGKSDDVRLGENGLEYPYGDVAGLAEFMRTLATNGDLRARMAERSLAIGQERTMAVSVEALVSAVGVLSVEGQGRRNKK
jgi:glycosyltransferase involved in cell wall biosynthesis